ncbi:MAG: eukaryotic translation initiation factor eIF-2-beta/eIF-5 family protein [Oscillospiraceae bacterium]|nr:eukaryotic translation initiation factor eIF-2-beta/eIF-5 family protein [Oscillospiraceae bacterium]
MMKWEKNLISISKSATSGICPECGSPDTEFYAKKIVGDLGYILVWCNSCKKGTNISRTVITDDLVTHNTPPDFDVQIS